MSETEIRKAIRPLDRAPDGLQRIDGSLCLDLLPLEYYGKMHRVIEGPLYDPAAIDLERVYETTRIGRHPIDSREQWADLSRPANH